jgi:ring-1,2-phenylacetyl-CoA epoxidase subunit PaaC
MEMPKGDFAYSQVRQLFVDVYYTLMLPQLQQSEDETLAAIASKAIKETKYHLRRSRDWVLRLGDGTEESHRRTQKAVDALWGYTHEMFDMDETEQLLADNGIGVDVSQLRDEWHKRVSDILTEATLTVPEDSWAVRGGRTGYHTENLGHMLTEMQIVHRSYPGCQW